MSPSFVINIKQNAMHMRIKGSDLKLYTITKWRRMAKGDMIIERKSIREEIEEEIRRWRETELQLDV